MLHGDGAPALQPLEQFAGPPGAVLEVFSLLSSPLVRLVHPLQIIWPS